VQGVQVPPEQTRFVPQTVPSGTFAAGFAVQTGEPVEPVGHWYEAWWQRSEGRVHTPPAVQPQTPVVHAIAVPQLVPSGWFAPVSVQTEVPVEQEVAPTWHRLVVGTHARFAVQLTQAPAEQTWFNPQLVPAGWLRPESTHTDVPVLQEVVPV
jgi:hypothetical protein